MANRKNTSSVVHELPDFVFVSHATQPLKMKWCVDCHKQHMAPHLAIPVTNWASSRYVRVTCTRL